MGGMTWTRGSTGAWIDPKKCDLEKDKHIEDHQEDGCRIRSSQATESYGDWEYVYTAINNVERSR